MNGYKHGLKETTKNAVFSVRAKEVSVKDIGKGGSIIGYIIGIIVVLSRTTCQRPVE